MARPRARPAPAPEDGTRGLPSPIPCPFVIVQDSREQSPYRFAGVLDDSDDVEADPYTFDDIRCDADRKYAPLVVRTVRIGQPRGDYSILGLSGQATRDRAGKAVGGGPAGVVVERKSLADLYGSVGRRENFIARLEAMQSHDRRGHIVVEASIEEVAGNPPRYTKLRPKALIRTIQSWANDYPVVHWWFMPGREWAESWTFRLLNDWYRKHKLDMADVTVVDQATGRPVRSIPDPLSP
jgi:hypothetical protein